MAVYFSIHNISIHNKRNIMEDFIKEINGIQQEYDREYLTKRLNIVTVTDEQTGDTCKRSNRVTPVNDQTKSVMKYYTVKPKEYFTDRHYQPSEQMTYARCIKDIPPRRFYTTAQIESYIRYLNRVANRTIEDAEMTLLLRAITNGRHYQLVCLLPIRDTRSEHLIWDDIK